ncbi:MAG: 2-amino-4-hydroxy-6-hydroxymethyldihydropteridine diphosphokinase [Pseudomonadota bacterium]
MPDTRANALIALGSNASKDVTENKEQVQVALDHIEDVFQQHTKKSKFYQTPAFPKGAGPDFVNAAISVETAFEPHEILDTLLRIEREMGRKRTTRWAQRKIDLDLIAVGPVIRPNLKTYTYWHDLSLTKQKRDAPDQLILPHPRLQDRAFVLGPLMDIAPDWRHPFLDKTIAEMWTGLPQTAQDEISPI